MLKPKDELTSLALVPDMRVSIITAIAGLRRLAISRRVLPKEVVPTPLQFQTRIFISDGLKGLVWWPRPDLRSLRAGIMSSCASEFSRKRKVRDVRCL